MKLTEVKAGDFLSSAVDIYSGGGKLIFNAGKKYRITTVNLLVNGRVMLITADGECGLTSDIFDITNFKKCLNYTFFSLKEERIAKIKSLLW